MPSTWCSMALRSQIVSVLRTSKVIVHLKMAMKTATGMAPLGSEESMRRTLFLAIL